MHRLVAGSLLLLALTPDADATSSRARQIIQAMEKQAESNAWEGVEGQYDRLAELDEALPANAHLLGARAAAAQGHAQQRWERLQLAIGAEDGAVAQPEVDAMASDYGSVTIKGKPAWHSTLNIQTRPFATDKAAAFDYAARRLKGAGSFSGMLPVGQYCVGTQAFEVGAGAEPVSIKLTGKDLKACSAW